MPNFTFTGPQGQQITVTGPDGSTPEQAFAMMQQHLGQTGGNPAVTKQPGYIATDTKQFTPIQNAGQQAAAPIGNAALGAAMGAGNIATGTLNAIPRGLMGLAGAIKGAVTPGETADNQSQTYMDAAPQIPQMQSSDSNTQGANQAVTGAAGSMANALPAGLNALYSKIRSGKPATAQEAQKEAGDRSVLDLFGNIAPMLVGAKLAPEAKPFTPEATPFQVARDAGYSIMPSEAAIKGGSAPLGKVVEGLAGSAKTGVDATVKNQAITNRLAAQEIGAPVGTPLTDTVMDSLRKPLNAVYDKVSQLGSIQTDPAYFKDLNEVGRTPGNSFPGASDPDIQSLKQIYAVPKFDAADAVLQIRNLRKNATANYKASAANQVKNAPMLGELADAQQGIANALEEQLDRFAGSPADKVGNPALIKDWRAARQGLAKINTVDNAIKEGTTDVSAPALAKQLNKGAPLSGNLRTIADIANAFPISIRDIGAVKNKVPINALEGLMGTGGIGAAMFGSPHAAAALGAGMITRPLARKGLLSSPIQDAMLPKSGMDPMFLRLLAGGALPALNSQENK